MPPPTLKGPGRSSGLTLELATMVNECGRAGANAFDFVEIYPETCGTQMSAHIGV